MGTPESYYNMGTPETGTNRNESVGYEGKLQKKENKKTQDTRMENIKNSGWHFIIFLYIK